MKHRSSTWPTLAVALLLTLAAPASAPRTAAAQPIDKPLNIDGLKRDMVLLHDGSGHYFAYHRNKNRFQTFYGDGQRFFQNSLFDGKVRSDGTIHLQVIDPRVRQAKVVVGKDSAEAICRRSSGSNPKDHERTPLQRASETETRRILERARFYPEPWTRAEHALARDSMGIYYFVDRTTGYPLRGYRLFVGEPGRMRQIKLKNVVSDSVGQVFATKQGALQVRWDRNEPHAFAWVLPNRSDKYELTNVPTRSNQRLIYNVLGPYGTARLGSHCDDL